MVNVKILSRGVVEMLRGSEVSGFVEKQAKKLADKANAQAIARRSSIPNDIRHALKKKQKVNPGSFEANPYKGRVKQGKKTSLGIVSVATKEGAYDNNQHHTLESLIT